MAIRWIKHRAGIVGGAVFAFAIGLSVISTIAADFVAIDAKCIDYYASSGIAFVFVATIYILIGLAVLRYFLSFFRGHPAGYGWERPSIHAHVTIYVESKANVPDASSNVCEIVPFTVAVDAKRGHRHSGLYEDKRILKALAYWMAHVK